MTRLRAARVGEPLEIRRQPLEFSYYPMRKGERRWGIHSMVYAADPWAVITSAVKERCPVASRQSAESFVRQAREYYSAAEVARTFETKPLLHYYSFLNLGKALGLARKHPRLVGEVQHGITHRFVAGETVDDATLKCFRSTPATTNAYGEIHESLTGNSLPSASFEVTIGELLPQSVVAHRLWIEATGAAERFLTVDRVQLMHDANNQTLWVVLQIERARMERRGLGLRRTMERANLGDRFEPIEDATVRGTIYRQFQMKSPISYNHRAADDVMKVVDSLKPDLWRTITSTRPYRRYYIYLDSPGATRLPQEMSAYALLFFLGSLTRYRPSYLLDVLEGRYGAFVREFLATQPAQLLYSMATEVKHQEVTRAGVV